MRTVPQIQPLDAHNEALLANVHPAEYRNPDPQPRYNLVVVGAGSAGLITSAVAAGLGAKVALVERHLLGGDCLNVGCVPSKSVIRSARAVGDIRGAEALGVRVKGPVEIDFAAVMERMRGVRAGISALDAVARYSEELGVDVFLGDARFSGPREVEVDGQTLRFAKAVIATGARASAPPIEGLAEVGYLTNETVFSLTERPTRLAVIGAGPIGCELAQSFQRLGSQVTLLEILPGIMGREDRDAAAIVEGALLDDGIDILLEAQIRRVERSEQGKVLRVEVEGQSQTIVVDEILVGAGRKPNVEGLDLEAVGVEYDPVRGVRVNDRLQTTNPRIYAAGDICLAAKFTHMADATAKMVVQNALFFGRKKLSDLIVPWCTYTDPEVAHVGLSEQEATERGVEIDTYRVELGDNDRARTEGDAEVFCKVHVAKGRDRILGATIVARHAGEMISEVTVAMTAKLGLGAFVNVIHPYPTQAELLKAVAGQYTRTRLTPGVAKLFERFLALRR